MSYTRTQVYLDPEDHARLAERARAQGKSLTALLRELVSDYLARGPEESTRGFDALIGVADGPPSDVAADESRYLDEAREARLRKKLGR